ncbi:putative DNA-binding protein [Cecembia calidifontis]|uniref:Putative DNA-binding protein n=2 Tax=Cecembia calidifontis TaxID=1187080 RepID=A0A4Q7PD83_9BACT|nr:putative DNA-binding protein [Cecembia calidifontis]
MCVFFYLELIYKDLAKKKMMDFKKDDEFISELLKADEGEVLDFKQSINKSSKIAKTMVAFANTKGGKIAIGISDRKKITGIDVDEELFMIEKANKEYCFPPVEFSYEVYEIDRIEGKELVEELHVLIINVLASSQGHFYKNPDSSLTRYVRVKDESVPV